MGAKHMLKYHVLIPLGIVAVLLVVGVPFGTALVVGMMTGCMSMMLMMMGGAGRQRGRSGEHDNSKTPRAPVS
jgi:MFS superfamily sulfate permease-like transporter